MVSDLQGCPPLIETSLCPATYLTCPHPAPVEQFPLGSVDLEGKRVSFIPAFSGSYVVYVDDIGQNMPNISSTALKLDLGDDSYQGVYLGDNVTFLFYGEHHDTIFIGSNGDIAFGLENVPSVSTDDPTQALAKEEGEEKEEEGEISAEVGVNQEEWARHDHHDHYVYMYFHLGCLS